MWKVYKPGKHWKRERVVIGQLEGINQIIYKGYTGTDTMALEMRTQTEAEIVGSAYVLCVLSCCPFSNINYCFDNSTDNKLNKLLTVKIESL